MAWTRNKTGIPFGGGYRHGWQPGMTTGLDEFERMAARAAAKVRKLPLVEYSKDVTKRIPKGKKMRLCRDEG